MKCELCEGEKTKCEVDREGRAYCNDCLSKDEYDGLGVCVGCGVWGDIFSRGDKWYCDNCA